MIEKYLDVQDVISVMEFYGLEVFKDNSKDYNFNILNIRSLNKVAGKFDDIQYIFWRKPIGNWVNLSYKVTVDPGIPYLLKPLTKKGTAIVLPGQYKGLWKIGKHKGKYLALVQKQDIMVVRDNNMDEVLNVPTYYMIKDVWDDLNHDLQTDDYTYMADYKIGVQKGYFGINCHRASSLTLKESVGYYSAGCCVYQNNEEYEYFIELCISSANKWGNSFTATWLDELDFIEAMKKISPSKLPLVDINN